MDITNIKGLRDDLLAVYKGVRKKEITHEEAKGAALISGRVIGSCRVQLDYAKQRGEKPYVVFLVTGESQ